MTHAEQHRMIDDLRDFMHRMTRREQEEFEMFLRRDKDDEDLDVPSQKRLQFLHGVYARKRGREM
ncbi:MAG: hypothetical protein WB626_04505 [Bacteroidota bacterium]